MNTNTPFLGKNGKGVYLFFRDKKTPDVFQG
jgi:hypothetical protein